MDCIKIIFADNQKMVREGLGQLLDQQQDMIVVGEAHDGVTAIALTLAMRPDVLLLDLNMPGLSGLETLKQLRDAAPVTRVVCFTMNRNNKYLSQAFQSGAIGYVLKGGGADQLLEAIRAAYLSKYYLSPSLWTTETVELLKSVSPEPSAIGS